MVPATYDTWKTAAPGERFSDNEHTGVCPNCNRDCYGKSPQASLCPDCRTAMCGGCRKSHRCECGKVFCETCLTRIDGLWLCEKCLAIHLVEVEELERVRAVLNVRAARTLTEKQLIALDWASGKVLRDRAA